MRLTTRSNVDSENPAMKIICSVVVIVLCLTAGLAVSAEKVPPAELHPYSPYEGVPLKGAMATIQSGKRSLQVYVSKTEKPTGAVLVIHEWWGLNDQIRFVADRLADDGFLAVAVDLYGGKVTSDPKAAGNLMRAETEDESMVQEKLGAAIRYIKDDLKVDRIVTMGYCLGGSISLQAAISFSDKLRGAVIYYGFPDEDNSRLKKIKIPLLGIYGNLDTYVTPAVVDDFTKRLSSLGVRIEVHRYDAVHAFANPSNANYNGAAAKDAWEKTEAFLNRVLK